MKYCYSSFNVHFYKMNCYSLIITKLIQLFSTLVVEITPLINNYWQEMLLLDLDINQINFVDVQTFFLYKSTDEQTEKYSNDHVQSWCISSVIFLLIVLLIVIDVYVVDQNNVWLYRFCFKSKKILMFILVSDIST